MKASINLQAYTQNTLINMIIDYQFEISPLGIVNKAKWDSSGVVATQLESHRTC